MTIGTFIFIIFFVAVIIPVAIIFSAKIIMALFSQFFKIEHKVSAKISGSKNPARFHPLISSILGGSLLVVFGTMFFFNPVFERHGYYQDMESVKYPFSFLMIWIGAYGIYLDYRKYNKTKNSESD